VQESILIDPALDFPINISAVLMRNALSELKSIWRDSLFGDAYSSAGLLGYDSSIDAIINGNPCNDTNNIACYSMNDVMIVTEYVANNYIFVNASTLTSAAARSAVSTLAAITSLGENKTLAAVSKYIHLASQACTFAFPMPIVYVFCLVTMTLLVIPIHSLLQTYLDVNHKLRMALVFLQGSQEVVEDIPEIKNFVDSHSTVLNKRDRIKMLQSGDRLMAVLEACVDGVVICTATGTVVELTSTARDMFGNSKEDMVGLQFNSLFQQSKEFENLMTDVNKFGKGITREFLANKKNGSSFPVRISLISTKLDGRNMMVCFCGDITLMNRERDLLAIEKKNNEQLLLEILPAPVAARLRQNERSIAERFESVTCFFSDMVGFTIMSAGMSASELVDLLNKIVTQFDDLCVENHLEKIKTIVS
jgi:PAS domain S-box-containing protein